MPDRQSPKQELIETLKQLRHVLAGTMAPALKFAQADAITNHAQILVLLVGEESRKKKAKPAERRVSVASMPREGVTA